MSTEPVVRCELPHGKMWSGLKIPKHPKGNIFKFITRRQHWDPTRRRVRAMLRFKLNKEQYEYWYAEWRHLRR